jgi:hypothetical protein
MRGPAGHHRRAGRGAAPSATRLAARPRDWYIAAFDDNRSGEVPWRQHASR